MKTIADLNTYIPAIVKMLNEQEHIIGDDRKLFNSFTFEEDGWQVDVSYECIGEWCHDKGGYWTPPCDELLDAWGYVIEIMAFHTDEKTGEETTLKLDENDELWKALNESLQDLT